MDDKILKEKINLNNKCILVTGSPGFIGANLVLRLLKEMRGGLVISFDNMNDYYDPKLKEYRLGLIEKAAAEQTDRPADVQGTTGENTAGRQGTTDENTAGRQDITDENMVGRQDITDENLVGRQGITDDNSAGSKDGYSAPRHIFIKGSIADKALVDEVFEKYKPSVVVNLAAQAGVRYSIDHPDVYIESNIIGFYNILEACRHSYDGIGNEKDAGGAITGYKGVEHLVYASSSSVYGGNKKVPFSVEDKVDNPVSLYAATKKSNELLAHSYSKLYNIPSTGLRFFTVYGPAGRPDMFYYSATRKLAAGENIKIFNYGNCKRDFTYVDDIVEGVYRVMQGAPLKENGEDGLPIPPYAVYNIGGGQPENLLDYVAALQEALVKAGVLPQNYDFEGHRELVGMQPGDVPVTYADSEALARDYGFTPGIGIREGLQKFADWYREYYK